MAKPLAAGKKFLCPASSTQLVVPLTNER